MASSAASACAGVGAAGLGQVRPPAATLAAHGRTRHAHQVYRAEPPGQVGADPHHDARLALGRGHDGHHAAAHVRADRLRHALQVPRRDLAQVPCRQRHAAHLLQRRRTAARGELLLQLHHLVLQPPLVLLQRRHALRHLPRLRPQQRRRLAQPPVALQHRLERGRPRHGLDPPHPGAHAALGHDPEQPDIARPPHMRAAAELDRERRTTIRPRAHRDHAHLVAILFPEQRHRPLGYGGLGRHEPGRDLGVAPDLGIHLGLDGGQVVPPDRRRLAHVEAQAVGRVQAALLRHVRTQPPPQRRMQQVRRAVVRADRAAPGMVHAGLHRLPRPRRAARHGPQVHEQVAQPLLRVCHLDQQPVRPRDPPGIAHLAAALGIERRLVQHDGHLRVPGPASAASAPSTTSARTSPSAASVE